MSEEIALAAADLATVEQLRAQIKALSLQIGEQNTTIGYQDAMLAELRRALEGTTRMMAERCNNNARSMQWMRDIVAANQDVLRVTAQQPDPPATSQV